MTERRVERMVDSSLERAGVALAAPESKKLLEAYVREVSAWSERVHLVGRGRLESNIARLVLDSLLLLWAADECRLEVRRAADIGSGAGFPGLIWRIARPDIDITLFERRLKPRLFLERTAAILGLDRVRIVGEDAGVYGEPGTFDIVASKAAGRLPGILPIAERLLARGGAYITIKGGSWKREAPAGASGLMRLESVVDLPEKRGAAVVFRKGTST